jgi:acetylglutamate kinase
VSDDEGVPHLLSEVPVGDCPGLVASGVVRGGMVPKVEGCVRGLEAGVKRAHIIDGRVEHSLVLEMLTPEGLGTMITRGVDA